LARVTAIKKNSHTCFRKTTHKALLDIGKIIKRHIPKYFAIISIYFLWEKI